MKIRGHLEDKHRLIEQTIKREKIYSMSDDTGGGPREHALNIVAARKRGMTIQRETVNHQ